MCKTINLNKKIRLNYQIHTAVYACLIQKVTSYTHFILPINVGHLLTNRFSWFSWEFILILISAPLKKLHRILKMTFLFSCMATVTYLSYYDKCFHPKYLVFWLKLYMYFKFVKKNKSYQAIWLKFTFHWLYISIEAYIYFTLLASGWYTKKHDYYAGHFLIPTCVYHGHPF